VEDVDEDEEVVCPIVEDVDDELEDVVRPIVELELDSSPCV